MKNRLGNEEVKPNKDEKINKNKEYYEADQNENLLNHKEKAFGLECQFDNYLIQYFNNWKSE